MKCPVIVVALIAALLASGCADPQVLLRPGEDPNEVAAAIDQNSRGEGPPEPDPPKPKEGHVFGDYLAMGMGVAGFLFIYLPLKCAYGMAQSGRY
jgi:hypothetical protein